MYGWVHIQALLVKNLVWIPSSHWDLDPNQQFKKMLDPLHHNPGGGGGINNALLKYHYVFELELLTGNTIYEEKGRHL
jgi:hypothetical protein